MEESAMHSEAVDGRYVNYAEGFSVGMPVGLKGKRGQAAGPERGVSIPLSANCVGVIVVYGEPNSAEWANPAVAIVAMAGYAQTDNGVVVRRYRTKLGRLPAFGATIRYRDSSDIEDLVIAFRPGGGPMYTARLATPNIRYRRDHQRFIETLRSFRLAPWR